MSNLWADVDRAIDAFDKIGKLSELRDKVAYAKEATIPKCGQCYWWMKSKDCPLERNVNGFSRGPSINHSPCEKFQITDFDLEIIQKRAEEAIAFAKKHDLPIPDHLRNTVTPGSTEPFTLNEAGK